MTFLFRYGENYRRMNEFSMHVSCQLSTDVDFHWLLNLTIVVEALEAHTRIYTPRLTICTFLCSDPFSHSRIFMPRDISASCTELNIRVVGTHTGRKIINEGNMLGLQPLIAVVRE